MLNFMIKREWRPKIPCQNRVHTLIFELLQNGGKHVGRHKDRRHSRIACQIWGHVADNSAHGRLRVGHNLCQLPHLHRGFMRPCVQRRKTRPFDRLQAHGLSIDLRQPAARARQWHQPDSGNDKDLGICILMER